MRWIKILMGGLFVLIAWTKIRLQNCFVCDRYYWTKFFFPDLLFVCFCSTNMCIQSFLNYSYLFLFLLRCLQSSNSLFLSQHQQLQPASLRWDVMFFFFGSILKSIKQLQLMGEVQHLLRLSSLYLCYTGSSCQSTSHLTACVKPPGWQRPDHRSSNQKQDHARFTKRFPVPQFMKINLPTHLSLSDNITTE